MVKARGLVDGFVWKMTRLTVLIIGLCITDMKTMVLISGKRKRRNSSNIV